MKGELLLDHAQHVLFAEDQVVLTFDADLGAGVLAEEDGVPGLDVQRADLAVLEDLAVAHRHHLGLQRLLLGGVGNDDSTLGLVLLGDALDDQPILQRTNLHGLAASGSLRLECLLGLLALDSTECQRTGAAHNNRRDPAVKTGRSPLNPRNPLMFYRVQSRRFSTGCPRVPARPLAGKQDDCQRNRSKFLGVGVLRSGSGCYHPGWTVPPAGGTIARSVEWTLSRSRR